MTSILSGETPVYSGGGLIALMLQRRDLCLQYHLVADSAVEAQVSEHTQLDLGHVEPTTVFGSVMKLQTLGDASRFGWLEGVVQRTELVSV